MVSHLLLVQSCSRSAESIAAHSLFARQHPHVPLHSEHGQTPTTCTKCPAHHFASSREWGGSGWKGRNAYCGGCKGHEVLDRVLYSNAHGMACGMDFTLSIQNTQWCKPAMPVPWGAGWPGVPKLQPAPAPSHSRGLCPHGFTNP
jgi:hypothetical protein